MLPRTGSRARLFPGHATGTFSGLPISATLTGTIASALAAPLPKPSLPIGSDIPSGSAPDECYLASWVGACRKMRERRAKSRRMSKIFYHRLRDYADAVGRGDGKGVMEFGPSFHATCTVSSDSKSAGSRCGADSQTTPETSDAGLEVSRISDQPYSMDKMEPRVWPAASAFSTEMLNEVVASRRGRSRRGQGVVGNCVDSPRFNAYWMDIDCRSSSPDG